MDGEQKKKDPAGDGDPGDVKSKEKSEKSSTPVKVKEEPSGTSSTSSTPSKSGDVKSEPKSSGGGSAAAGASSSGGSEDMSEMDKAALSKALQDYMALAQTANALQNAQQVQQMSLMLQAYGPQAMAYLQAAAVTGNMSSQGLALAMMQQAQQQQQQAAAMSMLPKRGRGSRGGVGSRGGRGGANAANLKLKRLDSSELLGTGRGGGGRGRGVRGRRRLEGSYSNDFLYYMNEGGIRSGSTIGPTGSPSRLMTSTSGDGSPYDMLEQEELLYTENFPGKLCALCNLSERSTLGQGDIIKLKVTLGDDGAGDSSVKSEKSHSETGDQDEDMKSPSSSSSNLNARRLKGRKFTSGEGYEPFDELENIGFAEEPDISLLFETSGYFYVHENCAVWSDGVTKKAVKSEDSSEATNNKTPEKNKKKDNSILIGVSKAVKASTNQRCAYCKHFGASVKCMASGKMYHFPCAAASGSFMHKPTMTLVGTESLSKVSTYSDNAMYLYHNGEAWKFGKVGFPEYFSKAGFYVKSKVGILEVQNLLFFVTHWKTLNFDFYEFLHFWKAGIYQIIQISEPKKWQNLYF